MNLNDGCWPNQSSLSEKNKKDVEQLIDQLGSEPFKKAFNDIIGDYDFPSPRAPYVKTKPPYAKTNETALLDLVTVALITNCGNRGALQVLREFGFTPPQDYVEGIAKRVKKALKEEEDSDINDIVEQCVKEIKE